MQELAWFSTGDHSVFVWYHLFNDRTGEEIRTSQYGESCYTEIENMFRDRPRNCSIIFRHAPYLSMHHFLACLKTKTPILSWHPCDIISIRVLHYENTYCVLTASEVATMCDLHYEHTNYILTAFRLTTFCGLQMRKKVGRLFDARKMRRINRANGNHWSQQSVVWKVSSKRVQSSVDAVCLSLSWAQKRGSY